jgi:hypothetical protein
LDRVNDAHEPVKAETPREGATVLAVERKRQRIVFRALRSQHDDPGGVLRERNRQQPFLKPFTKAAELVASRRQTATVDERPTGVLR